MATKNDIVTFKELFGPVHREHVLPELDSQNLTLELHCHGAGGDLQVATAKILGVTGEHLLVERPKTIDKELTFVEGMKVLGFMNVFGSSYCFESTIAGVDSVVRLNGGKQRVLGMIITRPESMVEGEKRETRRLPLAQSPVITSEFYTMVGGRYAASTPIDVTHFNGQVVNFSRGGIAVRVEGSHLADLPAGTCFTFRFDLPGCGLSQWFAVEMRYAQSVAEDSSVIFGFKFLQLPNRRVFRETLRPYVRQVYKLHQHV